MRSHIVYKSVGWCTRRVCNYNFGMAARDVGQILWGSPFRGSAYFEEYTIFIESAEPLWRCTRQEGS